MIIISKLFLMALLLLQIEATQARVEDFGSTDNFISDEGDEN